MAGHTKHCVITGLGMITAIGSTAAECWENAMRSVSGIAHTHTVDTENCYSDYAAEVRSSEELPGGKWMDRASRLCLKAVDEALDDAGLDGFHGSERAGVIMGSCVGGVKSIERYYTHGKPVEAIAQMPISAIASQAAGHCQACGPVLNIANACAAGTISIAHAADLIRSGKADVVVAGGADAFASVPYSGFLALHALDKEPCSPFGRSEGITLGEGAGAVIVESEEHALKRGAQIYCYVLGAGISSDAYHITAPRPDGQGQMSAIRRAIKSAGVSEDGIDYVNAHGTGTAKNDSAEFLSLHVLFDEKNPGLSVSSTKAMTGHCLGAAGAIEAVFAIKALRENRVPPTLGFGEHELAALPDKAGGLDMCPNVPRAKELRTVMSNSFAFGGNNASIIFSKNRGNLPSRREKTPVCITGIGIVTPAGNGVSRYIETCGESRAFGSRSSVGHEDYDALGLCPAFTRKLDRFSQLQAVSGMGALEDGNLRVTEENAGDLGIVVGTSEGALATGCDFEMLIAEKGNANGSAFKFPNTVYNAAGGYLSICAGAKGCNVTVTNGAQSGLAAIGYALEVLRSGEEQAMLASGTDENCAIIEELYNGLGAAVSCLAAPYSNSEGFYLSDGSTTLLLETEDSAMERGAWVYAHVSGYGTAHHGVPFGTLSGSEEALDRAIAGAMEDAELETGDIDAVIGFANGHSVIDRIERESLGRVLGERLPQVPVLSIKEHLGEGRAASAALGAAHAALMLHGDICGGLGYCVDNDGTVKRKTISCGNWRHILVIAYGAGGTYSAVIISK